MKVSKKRILKVLDECGIDADCPDVTEALGKLFPEMPKQGMVHPDRIKVKVQGATNSRFDIGVYVDGKKVGSIGGGIFASNQMMAITMEKTDKENFGGYYRFSVSE